MPARSERITIVPYQGGQPSRFIRFPIWWDRDAFFEKFRQREIDTGNPIDANFAWLLSAGEAMAWDKSCKEQFSVDPRCGDPAILEDMRQLGSALREASWVIVESYEWESGLE